MSSGVYERTDAIRKKVSEKNKGKHLSPATEFKKGHHSITEFKKGHIMTKETREKIKKIRIEKPVKYWLGKHLSNTHRKNIAKSKSGKKSHWYGIHRFGKDAPNYKPESHIIETRVCECGCGETFNCLSISKKRFILGHASRGKNNSHYGKKNPFLVEYNKKHSGKKSFRYGKSTPRGKGSYYNGIWLRSSWEIKIAEWLDKQKWKWLYEPKRFELRDRTYCPDFYLPDLNMWWEIKGWFHKKHQETIRQFRELYPSERLVVITKDIYHRIILTQAFLPKVE